VYGRPVSLLVALVLITISACAGDDQSSVASTDDADGTPASDLAVAADEETRLVPAGYADCGSVNLTSGWPTTTVFNVAAQGECIIQAETSGEPTQQAYSGRDNEGGMVGSIVRVSGPEDATVIDYHIDPEGVVTISTTTCVGLQTSGIGPPTCPGSQGPAPARAVTR
jgi:hypothetical protein